MNSIPKSAATDNTIFTFKEPTWEGIIKIVSHQLIKANGLP